MSIQPSRLPLPSPPLRLGLVIQCKLPAKITKALQKIFNKKGTIGGLGLTFNDQSAEARLHNFGILCSILNPHGAVKSDDNLNELCGLIEGYLTNQRIYWQRPVEVKKEEPKQPQRIEIDEDKRVDEFYKSVKYSHNPQAVQSLSLVDGRRIRSEPLPKTSQTATTIDSEIQRPDSSSVVTSSIKDGEVSHLQDILKGFVAELQDTSNEGRNLNFTVELAGRDGACDGCKKRIAKFLAIWKQMATELLLEGVTATLTLTYKYKNEAYEPHSNGNVYGWGGEFMSGQWITHREQETARGSRKKPEKVSPPKSNSSPESNSNTIEETVSNRPELQIPNWDGRSMPKEVLELFLKTGTTEFIINGGTVLRIRRYRETPNGLDVDFRVGPRGG